MDLSNAYSSSASRSRDFFYFDDDKGFLSQLLYNVGRRRIEEITLRQKPMEDRTPQANSVNFSHVVPESLFHSSSSARTSNVHYPFLNSSSASTSNVPHPKVIVARRMLTHHLIVESPVARYPRLCDEEAYPFLGYPVNEQVKDRIIMSLTLLMMFREVGLDPEVQYVAELVTAMWVLCSFGNVDVGPVDDVDQNAVGNESGWLAWLFGCFGHVDTGPVDDMDHNAVGNMDQNAVGNEFGWLAWVFGGFGTEDAGAVGNGEGVVVDGPVNRQHALDIAFVYFWLPCLALLITSYGYVFNNIMLSIFQFVLGDWFLAAMPMWLRVLIFQFALISSIADEVYIAMMWKIADWAWNYTRSYVQNRVSLFYSSVFCRSPPPPPPPPPLASITDRTIGLIRVWRVKIYDNARRLVLLLPQDILRFLHMGSVTYVVRVFLSYYISAIFLLTFYKLTAYIVRNR